MNATIARLASIFGQGSSMDDNRAVVQFMRRSIKGENIVLKTRGLSQGNYVYTTDALSALLLLLQLGKPAEAYNIVNESFHMTVSDMAKLCSEIGAHGSSVVIDEDGANHGFAPDVKLRLSGSKLRGLGWSPEVDLHESLQRLADYLAASLA